MVERPENERDSLSKELAGAALYPFLIRYSEDDEEDLGMGVGAEAGLFYFAGGILPLLSGSVTYAMGMTPDTGSYYYVYY